MRLCRYYWSTIPWTALSVMPEENVISKTARMNLGLIRMSFLLKKGKSRLLPTELL